MQMKGDHVHFNFENIIIDVDSEDYYSAVLELDGVLDVTRDGQTINMLDHRGDNMNVINLERSGHIAELVVSHRYYNTNKDETHVYKFTFGRFDLRCEKQTGFL
jgi:hypothetical protein